MADQVQLRRGTALQIGTFTGAQGEVTPATDTNRLYVHDGVKAGGWGHALQFELPVFGVDTGSANALVISSTIGPAAPIDGMLLGAKVNATSTGGCTINYNGSGAVPLLSGTAVALVAGALQSGAQIMACYRASITSWILIANHGGNPQFASALPISQGGTGATTASQAVANLGLSEALVFAGTWNASTNTPTLTSGTGTAGYMYRVTTAGTTTLDGISAWSVGDYTVFNGISGAWNKIDGITNEVTSVVGQTGAVTAAQILAALTPIGAAVTNAAQSFTKTQSGTIQTISSSGTLAPDLTQGNDLNFTLTGSLTLANPVSLVACTTGVIDLYQDGTGNRTLASVGSDWRFGAAGTPVLSTAPNACDSIFYSVRSSGRIVATILNGTQ